MIALANNITTPQVFFNNLHIGGLDETIKLFDIYSQEASFSSSDDINHILARIKKSVLDQPPSTYQPKLRLPSSKINQFQQENLMEYEAWLERINEHDLFHTSLGNCLSIKEVTHNLMQNLSHQTIFHFPKFHTNCFRGVDAIKIFQRDYPFLKTVEHAMEFGQILVNIGIIHCVLSSKDDQHHIVKNNGDRSKKVGRFCSNGLFRLQPFHSPFIMNKFRLLSKLGIVDCEDPQPLLTLSHLTKLLDKAIAESMKQSSQAIDLDAVRHDETFRTFQENVCLLQLTNLDDMNENCMVAYFLNVYNLMLKHAIILRQYSPSNTIFYSKIKYIIGEYTFTLDEIYHGILRCNAKHPRTGKVLFTNVDDRSRFKCRTMNPRIHFAILSNYLNCEHFSNDALLGSNEFHPEALSKELIIVAQNSCKNDDRVFANETLFTLNLPSFVREYLNDFTTYWSGIDNYLPREFIKYLAGEKRGILDYMLQQSNNDSDKCIEISFGDTGGFRCLTSICTHSLGRKHGLRLGSFSRAIAEDELKLLDDQHDFFSTATSNEGFDSNSQISFSKEDFEFMSSDSSLDISFKSWEFPENLDYQSGWENFSSVSFEFPSETSTPPSPEQRKIGGKVLSPSTVRTSSTTQGSPSSIEDESSTPEIISNNLCLPEFPDSTDIHDLSSSDDEDLSYDSSLTGPPQAHRIESKSLFRDYEQNEDEVTLSRDIMNLFYPPENRSSNDGDSVSSCPSGDELDDTGKTTEEQSVSSIISHDTNFEEIFNSSMASI